MNDYGYLKVLAQLTSGVYMAKDSLEIPIIYEQDEKVQILKSSSGFQAILYHNTQTNEKVLAIRGTDGIFDI